MAMGMKMIMYQSMIDVDDGGLGSRHSWDEDEENYYWKLVFKQRRRNCKRVLYAIDVDGGDEDELNERDRSAHHSFIHYKDHHPGMYGLFGRARLYQREQVMMTATTDQEDKADR